jgi:hypothetical protein
MRGLSGAVTALILVVASVVIALIVVGFVFNLFGIYATQGANAIVPVGSAYLYVHSAPYRIGYQSGNVYLVATFNNKGSNVNISTVAINGTIAPPSGEYLVTGGNSAKPISGYYIPSGSNTLVIVISGVNLSNTVTGSIVSAELRLLNNQVIELNAYVAG